MEQPTSRVAAGGITRRREESVAVHGRNVRMRVRVDCKLEQRALSNRRDQCLVREWLRALALSSTGGGPLVVCHSVREVLRTLADVP